MRTTPRTVLLLALLAALAHPLFADGNEASSWLDSEPRARAYESVKPDIVRIFDDAQKAGVPAGPLMDKLKEGVSKHVDAGLLLGALRAELDRLSAAEGLLAGRASGFGPGKKESAVRALSLLLASGASAQVAGAVLDAGSASARDPSDTVVAIGIVAQVKLSIRLPDALAQSLGTALLRSRMPRAAFDSIPAIVLQARANGMSSEEAVGIVVSVLQSGGGLIQMQDRLQRDSPGAQEGRRQEGPGTGSAAVHPQPGPPAHPAGRENRPGAGP